MRKTRIHLARHIPRIREWNESGNTLYRTGYITMESTALPLWLMDKWLWIADETVHFIERRMPKDERGWSAIDRIQPYYGNPICAAYLSVWLKWYFTQQRKEVEQSVPFEKLSRRTQDALLGDEEDRRWRLCAAHQEDRMYGIHTLGQEDECDIILSVAEELRADA